MLLNFKVTKSLMQKKREALYKLHITPKMFNKTRSGCAKRVDSTSCSVERGCEINRRFKLWETVSPLHGKFDHWTIATNSITANKANLI